MIFLFYSIISPKNLGQAYLRWKTPMSKQWFSSRSESFFWKFFYISRKLEADSVAVRVNLYRARMTWFSRFYPSYVWYFQPVGYEILIHVTVIWIRIFIGELGAIFKVDILGSVSWSFQAAPLWTLRDHLMLIIRLIQFVQSVEFLRIQ